MKDQEETDPQQPVTAYINILQGKRRLDGGDLVYPEEVLDNLRGREEYLSMALELQTKVDGCITALGRQVLGEEKKTAQRALKALTETTLAALSRRIAEKIKLGDKPKAFVALAGPGGAGKDTVFGNATEELESKGVKVARVSKYTTRDSSRPGAYHFKDNIGDLLLQALSKVVVTNEEATRIESIFNIKIKNNTLTPDQLAAIQKQVDEEDTSLTEWNLQLDSDHTNFVEILYRKNRGWYATDGREILKALEDSDIVAITGNPQNLAKMINWVGEKQEEIIPIMAIVLPAYPSQFTSAARTLARDGIDQSDKELLSTTGCRQTDEMKKLTSLVTDGIIKPEELVVLENDILLSNPEASRRVKTLAGLQLARALCGKHNSG